MKKLLNLLSKNHQQIVDFLQIVYLLSFIVIMFTGKFGAILSSIVFLSMFTIANFQHHNLEE